MGAVTYSHDQVKQLLRERFVCLRANESRKAPETVEVLRKYRLLWSPGFVFLDWNGNELRRMVGYLQPWDFLAELHFALGMVAMLHTRYADSYKHFRAASGAVPTPSVAPEALYWAGIAAFRRDGRKIEVVRQHWEEIHQRFSESTWWSRADVFDVTLPGRER